MREFSIGTRAQAIIGALAVLVLGLAAYGAAAASDRAAEIAGLSDDASGPKVAALEGRLARMQANVVAIRQSAKAHVSLVERRQALIAAVLSGRADPQAVAFAESRPNGTALAALGGVADPLRRVQDRQAVFAAKAQDAADRRLAATTRVLGKLGIKPDRLIDTQAMGGPYEPVDPATATPEARADAQFRSLFMTWKKLDSIERGAIAIPAIHPITAELHFSSYFGVRSDPFRGTAAMHAGVDIPGPIGTPVYATADGIVERAGHAGGYGNLVELDHGKGIETRYGHLSKILVSANERVKRGQMIALMGSTGRSTGSHLHYEVRIDGHAVNPMPFLQTADYLTALQSHPATVQTAAAANLAELED